MLASLRRLITTTTTAAGVSLAAVAVPAHAAVFAVGPVAGGSAYVVETCGDSGSSLGWTETMNTHPATLESGLQCPPQEGNDASEPGNLHRTGGFISDRLSTFTDTPEGAEARMRWTAPAGTTVTRIRMWRGIHKLYDNSWEPYLALPGAEATPFDTCELNGFSACSAGGDWSPNDNTPDSGIGYRDLTGLNTSGLVVGLRCRPSAPHLCTGGASLLTAEAMLFGAFFTIAETTPPSVGTPAGAGWTATGWQQGTLSLSLSSADAVGISATRLYVDGTLAATTAGSCSWDRPVPCTNAAGASIPIDTTALADGSHSVQLAAVDAAGNETRVTRASALEVDNSAPAAPTGLAAAGGASNTTGRFDLSWGLPADAGAPITEGRYRLCRMDGTVELSCTTAATTTPTTLQGVQLDATATYQLRVWLVDALGHMSSAASAVTSLTRELPLPSTPPADAQAPPQPQPQPPPLVVPPELQPTPEPPVATKTSPALKLTTLRRTGRRVTIAGRASTKASGAVTIRYRARIGDRTTTVTKRAPLRAGRFSIAFTLSRMLAKATKAMVTAAYGGDADTVAQSRGATLRLSR